MLEDERFTKVSGRLTNREVLIPILTAIVATRTTKEWLAIMEEAGVPCGPINNYAEVFEDPQVMHRGIKLDIPHALGGTCPTVASPLRFSETPVEYNLGPPLLGQHTDQVLMQLLGKSEAEVQSLKQAGAV